MKAIVLEKSGGPDVLQVTEIDQPQPNDDEVLIKVKYVGVNYADILSRKGFYSWAPRKPYTLGLEAAGEVVEKGSNIEEIEIGDRLIYGGQKGGYAEYIKIHKDYILKAPEQYSWKEAAAFSVNWFTSWVALHEIARVRKKEILLVHSAAGGIGTASVQLGLVHDMQVYGTSSKSHKRQRVEELGAIALQYEDFDDEMRRMEKRPHCIIETVGGDVYDRSFKLLSPIGRIVLIGASGIKPKRWNPISLFKAWRAIPIAKMTQVVRQSKGFMGVHIGYLMGWDPQKLRGHWKELVKTVEEHDLRPEVRDDQIFSLSQAGKAHELIDNRENIGKVLLDPSK